MLAVLRAAQSTTHLPRPPAVPIGRATWNPAQCLPGYRISSRQVRAPGVLSAVECDNARKRGSLGPYRPERRGRPLATLARHSCLTSRLLTDTFRHPTNPSPRPPPGTAGPPPASAPRPTDSYLSNQDTMRAQVAPHRLQKGPVRLQRAQSRLRARMPSLPDQR